MTHAMSRLTTHPNTIFKTSAYRRALAVRAGTPDARPRIALSRPSAPGNRPESASWRPVRGGGSHPADRVAQHIGPAC